MVFPSLGNSFSRDSALEKNLYIGRGFGMIPSRKRLGRSMKANKHGSSDEKLALVSKTRKGKGKGSNKKGNNDGGST
jgi:hypothetical protein